MVSSSPAQLTIVRANGEHVADLFIASRRSVADVKTQLQGMEGIPVGRQQLWLEGNVLPDASPLDSLGVKIDALTLVLEERPPLLAGRLTSEDLESLAHDSQALEQAIDACLDDPQYTFEELHAVACGCARGVLGEEALQRQEEWMPTAEAGELKLKLADGSRQQRQACFTAGLRLTLTMLWKKARPEEGMERQLSAQRGKDMQALVTKVQAEEEPRLVEACSLRPVTADGQRGSGTRDPWHGAGHELQAYLQSRWTASEPGS